MFTDKKFISHQFPGEYLDYLYYQPETDQPLPLLIYTPGAGCRGTSLRQIGTGGFIQSVTEMGGVPARIVIPQCRFETWFDYYHVLCEFIRENIQDPAIDKSRVYITGTSMGAYAAWQLCISHPQWFAAAVPVCGGGMYWDAGRLKDIPVWAFHGVKDDVVYCCESQHMVDRINAAGGNAKLTLFPEADHNAWDPAYSCKEMWDWLFCQQKPNA
jgi:predicted peptidase